VLEYAEFVAAPYCAKLLADLGAEVIKIEKPSEGDRARRWGPSPGDMPHYDLKWGIPAQRINPLSGFCLSSLICMQPRPVSTQLCHPHQSLRVACPAKCNLRSAPLPF